MANRYLSNSSLNAISSCTEMLYSEVYLNIVHVNHTLKQIVLVLFLVFFIKCEFVEANRIWGDNYMYIFSENPEILLFSLYELADVCVCQIYTLIK